MNHIKKLGLALRMLERDLRTRNYYMTHISRFYKQVFGKRFVCRKLLGNEKHSGLPFRVLYFGEGKSIEYLKELFFRDLTEDVTYGSYSLLDLVRHGQPDFEGFDVCAREFTPAVLRLSRSKSLFTTPEWMEQEITLEGAWDDVVDRFRKNTRATELRKVRKYNFKCDVVTDRKAIEHFYDRLYFPYVTERFQNTAEIVDRERVIAVAQSSGLLRILNDSTVIAGAVLYYAKDFLDWIWIGALTHNGNDLEKGAFSALYYHSIKHAHSMGFKSMKIGNTRTFLNDGVYRYKRKWGSGLVRGRYTKTSLVLDFNFESRSTQHWLESCPFVTEAGDGLSANVFCFDSIADTETLTARIRDLVSPGMAGIKIFTRELRKDLPAVFESCSISQIELANINDY